MLKHVTIHTGLFSEAENISSTSVYKQKGISILSFALHKCC